ncbi:Thermostable carboxypeptidase 1 [Posidoniimonas polymericola]|uniref:Metal-dependent carboxypeptidase n=1 Tax=Posidoniimonas polymericola TaxID=2528002 RepID=A0A5C5ZEN8_9BACT|nr:carboxypeptidase M32 [Posidoniimonas polymericola]TWT85311.1 Thermostable carboxypeptidase 1 [Posidoniimonas polymericola]
MANPNDTFTKLCDHARQTGLLTSTIGILNWDEETYLPRDGRAHRAEQTALLAGMVHQRQTAAEVGGWLAELKESPLAADPHSTEGCVIRQLGRQYDKKTKLPQKLVEELTRTASLAQQAWVDARKADDFTAFQPWLERTIDLKQQEAAAVGVTDVAYDALLDDYEPGESTANVAQVLSGLREQLTPLVEQIVESKHKAPREILSRSYPVDKQAEFGKQAAAAIGFDFNAGRLDVTAHPFCGGGGPRDVRLTTRYDANEFAGGFFSILHEAGHGIYEQGLPADQFGLPTGEAVSLGIHESQSRMWENLVGRSRAYWEHTLPELQGAFESARGVGLDEFYFAVNDSRPSLIRTESDEATYNLHIIVRFELEQALLSGDLPAADLPSAWNEKYQQYLGVTPPSSADGAMQDVHWSAGLYGYFPTYALGNLYAAQFFDQAEADLGDLDDHFRRGEFTPLRDWLRRNIHQHGQRYSAAELVERVTGKPLSHEPLMRRLRAKFAELYDLP